MIETDERLRVGIPAGTAGEFSSSVLILCADFYLMSIIPQITAVAHKRCPSFCQKCRWQVTPEHAYTLDSVKSDWVDYVTVQA